MPEQLWVAQAWVAGGWQPNVLLTLGRDGHWSSVLPGQAAPPGARVLPGPALPGMVNAHSHAFQRAFAGLAERRSIATDDFWGWRERMYGVALRISPAQLQAVATQLYAELLQGGYTQVCEFHYLHHAPDGLPYAEPLVMAQALIAAAQATGIGLTLLPVLYERAGFDAPRLRPEQRRFDADVDAVLAMRQGLRGLDVPLLNVGTAIHSLRAAAPASIARLIAALEHDDAPIHIHIAEQTAEVDACLAATGCRPIEWLCREVPLDSRWQLVHALHATPAEIDAVAATGAGVVLCPSTEANLGDGLADLPRWLAQRVPLAIGSDSQVGRSWPAELRLLEYGQRLALRQRNVASAPELGLDSSAQRLFNRTQAGSAAAAGFDAWGLVAGARADLLVLDPHCVAGVPAPSSLDALVFASDRPSWREVWVAGQPVLVDGAVPAGRTIADDFSAAMTTLWPR